jgi:hypothetical protein
MDRLELDLRSGQDEATVTCSLGHTSHAIEWPVDRPGGLQDPPPDTCGADEFAHLTITGFDVLIVRS